MSNLAEKLILEGELKGQLKGELKQKLEIAANMLRMGSDLNFIVQATNLSLDEVKELQKNKDVI